MTLRFDDSTSEVDEIPFFEDIEEALVNLFENRPCRICHSLDYVVSMPRKEGRGKPGPSIPHYPEYDFLNGGFIYPIILVICETCGSTDLFDSARIRVFLSQGINT
jgi:hypothetical protein